MSSETDPVSMESEEDAVTEVKSSARFTVKVEPLEQTILPLLDYANKHNDINAALELVKVEAIIQEQNTRQGKFHFQCQIDLETPGSSERVSRSSQNELTVGSSPQVIKSKITDTCSSAQSEDSVVQRTKTKRVRKSVQHYQGHIECVRDDMPEKKSHEQSKSPSVVKGKLLANKESAWHVLLLVLQKSTQVYL